MPYRKPVNMTNKKSWKQLVCKIFGHKVILHNFLDWVSSADCRRCGEEFLCKDGNVIDLRLLKTNNHISAAFQSVRQKIRALRKKCSQ